MTSDALLHFVAGESEIAQNINGLVKIEDLVNIMCKSFDQDIKH